MKISKVLVKADNVCNYIPVVSVINNLVDLVAKAIFNAMDPENIPNNKWTRHIVNKPVSDSLLYMIPFYGLITKVCSRPAEWVRMPDANERSPFTFIDFLFPEGFKQIDKIPESNSAALNPGFEGPCLKGTTTFLNTSNFVIKTSYIIFKVRDEGHNIHTVKLSFMENVGWSEVDQNLNSSSAPQFFIHPITVRTNWQNEMSTNEIDNFKKLLATGEATDVNGKKWFINDFEAFKRILSGAAVV